MFKNREKLYQIYHTLLSFALSWALTLELNQYYQLRVHIAISAVFALISAFIVYLFDINKKNTITYLLLAGVIPMAAIIFWRLKLNPATWIRNLYVWCLTYNGSEELYLGYHAISIVFGISLLGFILFYLLTKKQLIKLILAGALLLLLIAFSIKQYSLSKPVVGIYIFYILTVIVEVSYTLYNKSRGRESKQEGILYLAPVCLILALLSIGFPSKPEPIQWSAIKNLYLNIKEQFQEWETEWKFFFSPGQGEFKLALTGYSEEGGDLSNGTDLVKDNKIALQVSGSQGNNPVYLIGSVSDTYTGMSWERSKLDYLEKEEEYLLDYTELVYALSRQELETLESNRFIERKSIQMTYKHIKTKTFFYPLKTSYPYMISDSPKINTAYAGITFPKERGNGTTYETIFYEMNLQGEAFVQMLKDSDTFSYEEPPSIHLDSYEYVQKKMVAYDNIPNTLDRWDFYEVLKDRAEMINRQYTTLPEELPERVKELAQELTKNHDTRYEKLKAIETYLREYEYSLEAVRIPENVDFTDYFLFESRRGYCTSYATAMAVLGRCVGIPTRYVEGFIVKFEKKDKDNRFPVRNSQAHAWCEAYFEGIGWIPFEATAPFYSDRYHTWYEPTGYTDIVAPDYSALYNVQPYPIDTNFGPLPDIPSHDKKDNLRQALITAAVVISILLMLVLLVLIYYGVLLHQYNKRFAKADYSGKTYMLFLRILRLLKREGYVLGRQETILMLSARIKNTFCFEELTFSDIAAIYMRYRYGNTEVTKEEYEKTKVFHKQLALKQKNEGNRLQNWLEEFLFLMRKGNEKS